MLRTLQSKSNLICDLISTYSSNEHPDLINLLLILKNFADNGTTTASGKMADVGSKKAMNNEPSSEKGGQTKRLTDEERLAWHNKQIMRHKNIAKNLRTKKKKRKQKDQDVGNITENIITIISNNNNKQSPVNNDDLEYESEEERAADEAECKQHMKELKGTLGQSDGTENEYPQKNAFEINNSNPIIPKEKSVVLYAVVNEDERKQFMANYDTRVRTDFDISITKYNLKVETLTNPITGEKISASTEDLGPAGCRLTWKAFVNIILLVTSYAFPMNRLQKLLGFSFRVSHMVRYLGMFAWKFLYVYEHLYKVILANASILNTDDTPVRVNEVTRWKRYLKKHPKPDLGPPEPTPWERRSIRWKKKNRRSLFEETMRVFGFNYPKRNNEHEMKISLNHTVILGLEDQTDPTSRVVFYRTHFGNAGDLISNMLKYRKADNLDLIIQGDLSRNNTAPLTTTTNIFRITYAGCLAHARRDFVRYADQDPELTEVIISGFALISNIEDMIDDAGRNNKNTLAARHHGALPHWQTQLEIAEYGAEKWSKSTPLGKATRYIINHFDKLTYYIGNPKLGPTNNMSEGNLRYEAQEDSSSFGRDSVEGRFIYDICRSAAATCSYCKVDVKVYMVFIMLADITHIREHPELYTPRMFKIWLTNNSDSNRPKSNIRNAYMEQLAQRAQKIIYQ